MSVWSVRSSGFASLALIVSVHGMVAIVTAACSTVRMAVPASSEPPLPREAPEAYRKAVDDYEAGRFDAALEGLDAFVRREPATRWTQAAILNSGRALEGLGRHADASERYRSVIRNTDRAPQLQAMALYRLSFCHEALGEDQAVVATLHDVLPRERFLPKEIMQAELPARLAAAYARSGNFEKALEFYQRGESGIARLRRASAEKPVPPWLARTLYFMGTLSLQKVSWDEFETTLRPLGRGQLYLLQAAELGSETWSDQAARDLIGIYRDLWSLIENAPVPATSDPLIGRKQVQERQWDLASLLLERLNELRAHALPVVSSLEDSAPSEQARAIHAFADEMEKKIQRLLAQRPEGEGLTPESFLRRQSVRGRVVNPDGTLENRYLRGGSSTEVLSAPAPAPEPVSAPAPASVPTTTVPVEDPNL